MHLSMSADRSTEPGKIKLMEYWIIMRTLWLLRHAKSAWDTAAPSDHDRPLSLRGQRDAPRVGQWLARQDAVFDSIVCSTAARARETLAGVGENFSIDDTHVEFSGALYHAAVRELLAVVRRAADATQSLLLIGHNPGFDSLLINLCGTELPLTDSGKLMTTAALAQIELADWRADSGRLIELIRPRDLAAR